MVSRLEGGRRREKRRGSSLGLAGGWEGEAVREGRGRAGGVQFPRLVIGAASSGSKNSIYK